MWCIFSRNGLKGIEIYENESAAWRAADMRNTLVNQGWYPVFIKRGE